MKLSFIKNLGHLIVPNLFVHFHDVFLGFEIDGFALNACSNYVVLWWSSTKIITSNFDIQHLNSKLVFNLTELWNLMAKN